MSQPPSFVSHLVKEPEFAGCGLRERGSPGTQGRGEDVEGITEQNKNA